ncbi:MAG: hypothetical protein A2Z60_03140 [Nitrospirae bacterium RIFCSPLOWO2_02_42_7]|nr:MAG: hypothetical protein A2035_01870 [Nitrospirae bacterium GWA2_42_11]OGW54592.1 MAG: hypothetical protein A2Z60_03140 [Nitrospirae bacterium RIFCSPLOWO2_02_42_7]OGW57876.1 MAG: hypothetical protein A3D21_04930 [Nitrospirae bacterium RIFCSPHIGHO2_02_FULL_42_12]
MNSRGSIKRHMVKLSGKNKVQWGAGEIGGPRHEYRESLILGALRNELKRPYSVLDAGCGSGSLLFKIAGYGCRTFGLEQSKEYVETLRKRIKSIGFIENTNIKHGTVDDIPYPDRSFDVVVSAEVLEHVKDDTRAIMEFYRVLKPGGTCVISVPASPELWDITDEWAGHLRRYTRDDLISLFEKKGFIINDVRFWGFPFVRLYHKFLYIPHIKGRISEGRAEEIIRPPDPGRHQLMTGALSMVFKFDSLFRWAPFGIGIILKARKPGALIDLKVDVKLGAIGCTS